MERRGSQLRGTVVAGGLVMLCVVLGYVVVRNVGLKRRLAGQEVPYVWRAEELARLARKENPGVKVVLNGEKGLWDRGGGPQIRLVAEEVVGSYEDTSLAGMGGGVQSFVFAPGGESYAVFSRDGVVKKLDPHGRPALVIGGRGGAPGQLGMPMGVAFDPEGNVCVLEAGNRRVSTFSPSGQFLRSVNLEPLGWPLSFAIDSAGFYYVAWYDAKEDKVIHKYDPQGRRVLSFGEPVRFRQPLTPATAQLKLNVSSGPITIVGRYLYYAQGNPYEIRQYTTDGELMMRIFRKNSFLEPARIIYTRSGIALPVFSRSSRLAVWDDKIVHTTWLAPRRPGPWGRTVLDFFDPQGRLLTSMAPEGLLAVVAIDAKGKVRWEESKAVGSVLLHGHMIVKERR